MSSRDWGSHLCSLAGRTYFIFNCVHSVLYVFNLAMAAYVHVTFWIIFSAMLLTSLLAKKSSLVPNQGRQCCYQYPALSYLQRGLLKMFQTKILFENLRMPRGFAVYHCSILNMYSVTWSRACSELEPISHLSLFDVLLKQCAEDCIGSYRFFSYMNIYTWIKLDRFCSKMALLWR